MFWPQDWLWARELRKICIDYNFKVYRQCQKLKESTKLIFAIHGLENI